MRAAVMVGGEFSFGEVPDPTPGPSDLVLRVAACGICGSDIKTAPMVPDGAIMGHEFVGEVVAVGAEAAASWRVGSAAVSMPLAGCGTCPQCVTGDVARCSRVESIGLGARDGGFAEYVRVSARESVTFDGEAPLIDGALVEPLAVGLHAVTRAGLAPGNRVLVLGGGPVGMAIIIWLRRFGVTDIVVSDPAAARREAVLALGATGVIDPEATPTGDGFHVVFECVGVPGLIDTALAAVASRGRIVVAGVCMTPDPFMPLVGVVKDVDMSFVSYYTRQEFGLVAELLRAGNIDLSAFLTGTTGLNTIQQAVTSLRVPSAQAKILVRPPTTKTA
jgi:(R,R)-butanediol dehydrogenase/meso-butanediol dehydrogenase/diacetyl reductase